jgi:sugar O-acyltransferase (sialic acid O-acetyltransferase NeuD family)
MKSLLLLGGGGHCHSCIDVIETGNMFKIAGIVLKNPVDYKTINGYPVLGSDKNLHDLIRATSHALIAVGQIKSPEVRINLFNLLKSHNAILPVIRSPAAQCSRYSMVGEGTIIMHGCIINSGASIGANCIINSQALVEHDVLINDHCHISTGARVNGGVRIGKGSFIGSGAILKENIKIGESVVIGAGQVVLNNIPNGAVIKNYRV